MAVTGKHRRMIGITMLILGIVSVLVPIVWSLFKNEIFCDDAYYLCIVERMAEGYIPYVNLNLDYMPLWFYLMLAVKKILHLPYGCYIVYHIIHYLFQFGCAAFLYRILREYRVKNSISFFCAWLYIVMSHWLMGNDILLETPSLFFGLLSMVLILKSREKKSWIFSLIGIISCSAFLCKQYGFVFFVLDVMMIWLYSNPGQRLTRIALFLGGYCVPVLICFLYWGQPFVNVVFSGYGTKTADSNGIDFTLDRRLKSIVTNMYWFFWRVNPVIILSLAFIPKIVKDGRLDQYMICLFGIIGFSLQFFFVLSSTHYYLYVIPFGIMIIGIMCSLRWNARTVDRFCGIVVATVVIATVFMSCWSTYRNRLYRIYIKSDVRAEQNRKADLLDSIVPQGKTIWIHGPFALYYLSNRIPPNLGTIGYSFGTFGLDESQAWEQVKSADYVVRYTEDYDYLLYFTPEVKSYVEQFPFQELGDSLIVVHDMHPEIDAPQIQ